MQISKDSKEIHITGKQSRMYFLLTAFDMIDLIGFVLDTCTYLPILTNRYSTAFY